MGTECSGRGAVPRKQEQTPARVGACRLSWTSLYCIVLAYASASAPACRGPTAPERQCASLAE